MASRNKEVLGKEIIV